MSAGSFGLSYPPGTTWPREWEICILWASPKGQPTGRGLFHPPALMLSFSCQGGIALKWVGWSLRIQICYAYKTTLCPLEKCCVRLRAFPSPDFLVLMCSPPAKASLREGSLIIISKRCLSPPPSPAFQLFSLALLGTNMSVCLL